MINKPQSIPCPAPGCTGHILFSAHQLLEGARFSCPECSAAIWLQDKSSQQMVQNSMNQFDELKASLDKEKAENNFT